MHDFIGRSSVRLIFSYIKGNGFFEYRRFRRAHGNRGKMGQEIRIRAEIFPLASFLMVLFRIMPPEAFP
jgi:hypothetical protein